MKKTILVLKQNTLPCKYHLHEIVKIKYNYLCLANQLKKKLFSVYYAL